MMKCKRFLGMMVSLILIFSFVLSGCGSKGNDNNSSGSGNSTAKGSVYFLNFKPEIATVYEEIAKEYEAETGVKVKVVTAASNTYEQTLKSEIAKSDAPTIFQVNGPVGYSSWKNYCADLKGTKLYSYLTDQSTAITEGDGVYAIPYTMEGYGIIYNADIINKYFALDSKKITEETIEEVDDFQKFSEMVVDMQANKDKLGIQGVFASTSLSSGNNWRWQSHLANVPFYDEFSENTEYNDATQAGMNTSDLGFKYAKDYQGIFDLYVNNSCTEKGLLSSKSVDDSMAEFALGKCAMVQNGNWAWAQINGVSGNVVKEENVKFMPIYTGNKNDDTRGICIGTENYLAINKNASAENQSASIAFLEWLFSSEKGKAYVIEKLGFISPFNTFTEDERPSDPLAKEVIRWMNDESVKNIPWVFQSFPSEQFKTEFGDALLEYVQGSKSWDEVASIVRQSWKREREG